MLIKTLKLIGATILLLLSWYYLIQIFAMFGETIKTIGGLLSFCLIVYLWIYGYRSIVKEAPKHAPPKLTERLKWTPKATKLSINDVYVETLSKSATKFVVLGVIIGIFILISTLLFINSNNAVPETTKKDEGESLTPQEIVHVVTNDLNQDLIDSEKGKESNDGHLWWLTADGYNVQIPQSPNVIFKAKVSSDFISADNLNYIVNQPYNKTLTDSVIKLLKDYGFEKNDMNSSKNAYDNAFYDYILAYEKNDTICTWSLSPDVWGEGSSSVITSALTCSNALKNNYNEQKQILNDLQLKDAGAVIYIDRELNNFYYLGVQSRRTGYYIIAQKTDGKFRKIYEGQDSIPCSKVTQYNIPEYIYRECY
jgi:hypothetical protein